MRNEKTKNEDKIRQHEGVSTVSRVLPDGKLVELVYDGERKRTSFAIGSAGSISLQDKVDTGMGEKLIPIAASNNLIRHSVILLPERAEPFDSIESLVTDIRAYIDRYLDLTSGFRIIASWYVLLSWVYDAFNELPYLRFRGDYGSGKTRALTILGSLTYKAFFASGASTVSPIFYTLDTFQGTLILDEADFRFSDESAQITKILNNGNVKGFPVLRQSINAKKEFDPRAFNVFGAKIIAMRNSFDDPALESRCLTEEMGQRKMRSDIPVNLPDVQKDEALQLRNKLLMFRFQYRSRVSIDMTLTTGKYSSRMNQVLVPLLSIVSSDDERQQIIDFVGGMEDELRTDRSLSIEASLLEVLISLMNAKQRSAIPVSEITSAFSGRFGADFERVITARYVGQLLRKRLRLATYKTNGVYVVPIIERDKVLFLCDRFGVDTS